MLPGLLRFNDQRGHEDDPETVPAQGGDGADSGARPQAEPVTRLASSLPTGVTLTRKRQAWAAMRLGWMAGRKRLRAAADQEGGITHWLYHGQPESLAAERAYARSRAWVPPGHEGGIAERGGVVFHATIGPALKAYGNAISGLAERPLRACLAFAVTFALTVITLFALGLDGIAWGLIATVVILAGAIWGALEGWAALDRKVAEIRAQRESAETSQPDETDED